MQNSKDLIIRQVYYRVASTLKLRCLSLCGPVAYTDGRQRRTWFFNPCRCTARDHLGDHTLPGKEYHWGILAKLIAVTDKQVFSCIHLYLHFPQKISAVPCGLLHTRLWSCRSTASTISQSSSACCPTLPTEHLRPTGLFCRRPVCLELTTGRVQGSGH